MKNDHGIVYLVGAGPGAPGLITVKGLECLRKADVIIYDRLIDDSLLEEARPRAEKIYVGATHGVFAGQALENLRKAPIDEVVVTDTIPLNAKAKEASGVKVLTVSNMLGEAIKRIHRNESVSGLFDNYSP